MIHLSKFPGYVRIPRECIEGFRLQQGGKVNENGTDATGTETHQNEPRRRNTQPLQILGNCTAQRRAKAAATWHEPNAATSTKPDKERSDERTHQRLARHPTADPATDQNDRTIPPP